MSSLGVYFGSSVISLVEVQGKKVLNSIQVNRLLHSIGELGEKVPEEVKIVAILKEELRRNNIQAKEAEVALSGKDLIIRNFEMPFIPREELETAVSFEAKKYIPFKVEDMVSVFQAKADKASRQNLILFAGIKKSSLDKYVSIFKQLEIKFNTLEYAPFSALRFLRLAGLRDKGITCVVNLDMQAENEANFLVLENDFPLFCRDITLLGGPEGIPVPEGQVDRGAIIEKLKNEMRVSLDYYNRKFPAKKIQKVSFICPLERQAELEPFVKDTGLATQFIDPARYLDKTITPNPAFIKAYGSALSKVARADITINLLAAKAPLKVVKAKKDIWENLSLLKGVQISPPVLFLGAALCIGVFLFFSIYRIKPLKNDIKDILSRRVAVSSVDPQLGHEMLLGEYDKYKSRVMVVSALVEKEFYATEVLDALPRIIPDGMWLVALNLRQRQGAKELILNGAAYLADNTKELKLINDFISSLKSEPAFNRNFKDIALVSIDAK